MKNVLKLFLLLCLSSGVSSIFGQDQKEVALQARETFYVVEDRPGYPGGLDAFYQYMMQTLRYPKDARMNGKEGKMRVQFVIDKDGAISDVKTINAVSATIDSELKRVLAGAELFTPAKQREKPVRVRVNLPVTFTIDQAKKNPDGSPFGVISLDEMVFDQGAMKVDAIYRDGSWSGLISSPEGDVMPGASIIVEGTSRGTVSDLDGHFVMEADSTETIWVSFVGYETTKLSAH